MNGAGKTMVAPYSPRATPQATVSTPLSWEEVGKGIKPGDFHIQSVPAREENPGRTSSAIPRDFPRGEEKDERGEEEVPAAPSGAEPSVSAS